MSVLYIIGLMVGNLIPLNPIQENLNNTIGSIAIPFAIPLMLMGCGVKGWSTKTALKVFLSSLAAVAIVVISGFYLFRGTNDPRDFAQVSAVAIGIYTGGIPNMGAIAQGVGIKPELLVSVTAVDLIITGLYLAFVILFGKQVFRKLLGSPKNLASGQSDISTDNKLEPTEPIDNMSTKSLKHRLKNTPYIALFATVAIVGIAYLLAKMTGKGDVNMAVLILVLTTLSIGASFLKPIQRQKGSFDIGLYFVYVFCLSIATACNIHEFNLNESLNLIAFIAFVVFGSIVLQILFAKLLKIDGDSVLVGSVSLINSPPFVPLVAALLGNKDIVVLGITIGLLGYLCGNYLGLCIFWLLTL